MPVKYCSVHEYVSVGSIVLAVPSFSSVVIVCVKGRFVNVTELSSLN